MKKLFKFLIFTAIIFAVLIAGALGVLYTMYPPAKLKLMAQEYVKKEFKREVELESISFNLIGLTLKGFSLSESKTFKDGTFISAGKAVVKVELKPLFEKRVEIKVIGLEDVKINIIKGKDGKFNFDDLMALAGNSDNAPKEAQPADAAAPLAGLAIMAKRVYIKNADIIYTDKAAGATYSINGFNFELSDFDLRNEFPFSGSFSTAIKMPDLNLSPVNFAFSGKAALADMVFKNAYLQLDNFEMTYKGFKAAASGRVNDLENPAAVLNGSITGIDNKLAQEFVQDPLPVFALPKITLDLNTLTSLEKSTTRINEFKVSLGNSYIRSEADVDYSADDLKYSSSTKFAVNLSEVASIAKEMLAPFKLAGDISGNISAASAKDLPAVKGNIDFKNIGAIAMEKELKNLTGAITIASLNDIKSNIIKGVFAGSDFKTSFSYNKPAKVNNVEFMFDMDKFTLDNIDFDSFFAKPTTKEEKEALKAAQAKAKEQAAKQQHTPLVQPGPRSEAFNIKADITVRRVENNVFNADDIKLKVDLKDFDNKLDKAAGTISFNSGRGEIRDIDKLMSSSVFLKIILTSAKIAQKAFTTLNLDSIGLGQGNTITYNSIEGLYTLKDGIVTLNKSDINSDATTVKASGTVNLLTEKLNMKVQTHIGKMGTSGFKPVVINITGTLENPSMKLDVASTLTNVLGGSGVNTAKDAAKDAAGSVKNAVTSGIGSLLKK